ncbi:MAG: hypothetical protein ACFFAO_09815 [Candidatus Hermodarchaeota archaeon]
MGKTRSEDTLILNGLTPGITKMEPIYKALKNFFETKKSIDYSSRFNIILFQEDGPNYLDSFTLNSENVLIALKSLEPMITKANIGGGIFVAITFIIDVFKQIAEKTFRLIILTDSGTSRISEPHIPVIKSLIDQVKDMPFFIDIIRLNIDDFEEDMKLMDLAKRCNGGIHEINKPELLNDILEFLALKREIDPKNLLESKNYVIPPENHYFYENLAEIPLEITQKDKCSICHKEDNNPLIKCNTCGIITHKTCWALWTSVSSIGIQNVFRCHNCYSLVKLEKNFIQKMKLAERIKEANIRLEWDIGDIYNHLKSLEEKGGPKIVSVENPMPSFEISENLSYVEKKSEESKISETDNGEIKFILCPFCYKMITTNYERCPNCFRYLK